MVESAMNKRVFLSHTHGELDTSLVARAVTALEGQGFEVVLGESLHNPMEPPGEKVRLLIEDCDFFLGIVTQDGRSSEWLQQELGLAYSHRANKKIGVFVQEGASLGGLYSGLEYFAFREHDFEHNLESLVSYFERAQRGEAHLTIGLKRDKELRNIIDRLRNETRREVVASLLSTMESNVESFLDSLGTALQDPEEGILTKTGLDNFSMRTETFISLMDNMQSILSDDQLQSSLYRSGMEAGRTFGSDFCEHVLLGNKVSASSYKDFLEFWLYYDQTSGWGKPKLLSGLPEIRIEIRNSFLVRKSGRRNPHRYCSFLKGYIDGFLQFAMRRIPRHVHEAGVYFSEPFYTSRQVEHEAGWDQQCVFKVRVVEETPALSGAFDHLFKAGLAHALGDGLRCIQHCRAAMEFGVKRTLDRKDSDPGSFHEMVKQVFAEERAVHQLMRTFRSPKHYREVYGQLSKYIHELIEPDRSACRQTVLDVDEFLNALERLGDLRPEGPVADTAHTAP
jgi:predicted hydrocarbon binding protein